MNSNRPDVRTKTPTIYLLERNGRQQLAIRDKLRKHGYQVLVAHNPQLAVQRFTACGFDALVADLSRTQEEGFDALIKIASEAREWGEVCRCIVLLLPEQVDVACRIRSDAVLRDVVTILFRPVRLLELLATVKELVPLRSPAMRPDTGRRDHELAAV